MTESQKKSPSSLLNMAGIFATVMGCFFLQSRAEAKLVLAPLPSQLPAAHTFKEFSWDEAYDEFIEKRLDQQTEFMTLPASAMKNLCRNWDDLSPTERKRFWVHFIKSIAFSESSWIRSEITPEFSENLRRDAVTGEQVISEGLMQISLGDARIYGKQYDSKACQFTWNSEVKKYIHSDLNRALNLHSSYSVHQDQEQILHPLRNLACAMDILIILYDNRADSKNPRSMLQAGGAYWASLRPGLAGYKHFRKEFKREMSLEGHLCGYGLKNSPERSSHVPAVLQIEQ